MKITDLKKLLADRDAATLTTIISETYKLLPVKRKEEADVIIKNLLNGVPAKVASGIRLEPEAACNKTRELITGIRNGGYYDSFGYRDIREQWRYQATDCWKALQAIEKTHPLYETATGLMHDLLIVLEDAPHRGYLQTDNAFASMRVNGATYYRTYMKRVMQRCFTKETMFALLDTGAGEIEDANEYDNPFLFSLVKTIRDESSAMQSIAWTIEWMKAHPYDENKLELHKKSCLEHADLYIASQMFRFRSPAEAWDLYAENSPESNLEAALYTLLYYPSYYSDTDDLYNTYWLGAYRRASETGIVPRKELVREFNQRIDL